MEITTIGIVLKKILYGENSSICTIYTESLGKESFIISNTKKFQKLKNQFNLFEPTTIIKINFDYNNLKKIHRIKEVELYYLYKKSYDEILRSCIISFLIEVFNLCITHQEQNKDLFDFIINQVKFIDQLEYNKLTKIPLIFIYLFLKKTGHDFSVETTEQIYNQRGLIMPDINSLLKTIDILNSKENLIELASLNIDNKESKEMFEILIWHYIFIFPNFKIPSSIKILKNIML